MKIQNFALLLFILMFISFSCGSEDAKEQASTAVEPGDIVVNELMALSTDNKDWVEIYNTGSNDADLSNWALKDSKGRTPYTLPEGTKLEKGGYLVIEHDATGQKGFPYGLGKGDQVRLLDAQNRLLSSIEWKDGDLVTGMSWGRFPNGTGEFKVLSTPSKGEENTDECGNDELDSHEECDGKNLNKKSCTTFGFKSGDLVCTSKCRFDKRGCVSHGGDLVINEVMAKSQDTNKKDLPDWVEFFCSKGEVDMSGWKLKDSTNTNEYTFPKGTVIKEEGYLVAKEDKTGVIGFKFGLGRPDALLLINKDNKVVDSVWWKEKEMLNNMSWGRSPNGTGNFKSLKTPTQGAENK